MAIFGYIVFLLLTGWVTFLNVAVWFWPSHSIVNTERAFATCIMGLFWYGAYTWWPFETLVLRVSQ